MATPGTNSVGHPVNPSGASNMSKMGVTGHARGGEANFGDGAYLSAMDMAARKHYVQPTDPSQLYAGGRAGQDKWTAAQATTNEIPSHYNPKNHIPVPYSGPSELKEHMAMKAAIREAAGREVEASSTTVRRTDPIDNAEIAYLKSMKDQAELAKFDEYVETLIDPRKPGNMKWLMEVYPDYVERRLQQAHTDHEFALRNEMLDSWGINTFEDLHFKYLVDQGKIEGPMLRRARPNLDSSYTPGWLSPYNFTNHGSGSRLRLPFASAKIGDRPPDDNPNNWSYDRRGRVLGNGNDLQNLAHGMYGNGTRGRQPGRGPMGDQSTFGFLRNVTAFDPAVAGS